MGIWLFPVIGVGQLLVALVYAQFAARLPLSGGSYAWASRLANPRIGWAFGWMAFGSLEALDAQVNAGSVYWNCCDRVSPRLPWSGWGDSGMGLTLSTQAITTFTRPKAWHLRSPV